MQIPTKISLLALFLLPILGGCASAQSDNYRSDTSSYASNYNPSAELDSLLAPIALYPDTLLSHVLIASTYPLEVVQADRWASANSHLKGEAAVAAVSGRDWDSSVKALVAFPDVLSRMSEDLSWTEQLGDAFLADETQVMASVQRLRNRAYDNGNLASVEQVQVVRENSIVVIEPRTSGVIYAPYYDTRVVYGSWGWPDYPPTYWYAPAHVSLHRGYYWGPSIFLGSTFFFSGFNWHNHHLMVVDRPYLHRPYRSNHAIIRHQHARQWQHNPTHRRGLAYREGPAYQRFGNHMNRPAQRSRPGFDYRRDRPNDRFNPNRPVNRPTINRPNEQRPGWNRPNTRPDGNRPDMNRPNNRPSNERPTITRPDNNRPDNAQPRQFSPAEKLRQRQDMQNNRVQDMRNQGRPVQFPQQEQSRPEPSHQQQRQQRPQQLQNRQQDRPSRTQEQRQPRERMERNQNTERVAPSGNRMRDGLRNNINRPTEGGNRGDRGGMPQGRDR